MHLAASSRPGRGSANGWPIRGLCRAEAAISQVHHGSRPARRTKLGHALQAKGPAWRFRGGIMRTLLAALCIALIAGPAVAQIGGINMLGNEKKKTQEELDRDQAIDDAYKSTM